MKFWGIDNRLEVWILVVYTCSSDACTSIMADGYYSSLIRKAELI